ncbi:MAG TPA: hypothetical protein VK395_23355 [Gemmataceae bacterium]|nr:hypothetical protein [Gemmataceae bacterium]
MMTQHTIDCILPLRRRGRAGQQSFPAGPVPQPSSPADRATRSPGRVPRVARLMALALRYEQFLRAGTVRDYVALANLGQVSRGRISQIMNLRQLAPDIQEQILFLPCVQQGRDPIHLHHLQPLAVILDWRKQRRMWKVLQRELTL